MLPSETKYMRRALELARKGFPYALPNPMVGAVIVSDDGRIIGEGYHRRCGEAHAEVNAINQVFKVHQVHQVCKVHKVADEKPIELDKLSHSTIYVTLEPCAHYGRTGPCAKLIIDKGIGRVVVGTRDPFVQVDGKGIEMMRQAGIEVEVGMLQHECQSLNAIFFTAHTQKRPFIMLKWAQSADGYMDIERTVGTPALKISNGLTSLFTHRLRAASGGIIVGSQTIIADDPTLNTRLWPGNSPQPIVLDRRGRVTADYRISQRSPLIISDDAPLPILMRRLYDQGITSVLVEGGAQVLTSFIDAGLWDLVQVETGKEKVGARGRVPAPYIRALAPIKEVEIEGNNVKYYSENPLIDVKNL